MERYCYLHREVTCPVCGTSFDDAQGQVRFFWGLLGAEYQLGDPIRWTEGRGLLPRIGRALAGSPAVYGAPGLARVCVFDADDDYSFWRCRNGHEFDRPVISIEDNLIVSVRLLRPSDLVSEFGFDRGEHDALYFDAQEQCWKPFEARE